VNADPIVEDVHAAREAIAKRFNGDLRAICQDARKRQSTSPQKTRRLPPRPVSVPPAKAG